MLVFESDELPPLWFPRCAKPAAAKCLLSCRMRGCPRIATGHSPSSFVTARISLPGLRSEFRAPNGLGADLLRRPDPAGCHFDPACCRLELGFSVCRHLRPTPLNRTANSPNAFSLRPATNADRAAVERVVSGCWGSTASRVSKPKKRLPGKRQFPRAQPKRKRRAPASASAGLNPLQAPRRRRGRCRRALKRMPRRGRRARNWDSTSSTSARGGTLARLRLGGEPRSTPQSRTACRAPRYSSDT